MTNLQTRNIAFSQNQLLTSALYQNLKKIYAKDDENFRPGLGLCVQYLIEQRQNGPEMGSDYLLRLQNLLNYVDPDDSAISEGCAIADLEKILQHQFRHQRLSEVLKDLIGLHTGQDLELQNYESERDGCLICFLRKRQNKPLPMKVLVSKEDYVKKAKKNGLKMMPSSGTGSVNTPLSPLTSFTKQRYIPFMWSLANLTHNQYVVFGTKTQVMAITYHKIDNQSYWTFFDPDAGAFLYKNYEEFKSFMDNYFFNSPSVTYSFYDSQIKEQAYITYTRFSEINTERYDGIWKNFSREEEAYILDAFIKQNINLSFNKNLTGRILNYTLNEQNYVISMTVEFSNSMNIKFSKPSNPITLVLNDLPFSRVSDLHKSVLRRMDTNGALVPGTSVNPLDDLTLSPDLLDRLQVVIKEIEKIRTGAVHFDFIYQDKGLYNLLKEFFFMKKFSCLKYKKAYSVYFQTRQIEDIQKHIELNTGEIWHNGWRLFWGLKVTEETQNKYERAVIRKEYDEKLLEQATNILNRLSNKKIDVYYYSSGDFTLSKSFYKKIESYDIGSALSVNRILEDVVHPKDVQNRLKQYSNGKPGHFIRVVDSEQYYFDPPPSLFDVNDICDADHSATNSSSVKKVSLTTNVENSGAFFDFGDGDDIAVGYKNKKILLRWTTA